MKSKVLALFTILAMSATTFADWKISQKVKMAGGDGGGQTTTIYQKGVRQRRETKFELPGDANDPEVAEMMSKMGMGVPTLPTLISQCDLKQDVQLSEKNKSFFVDYYDWSTLPMEKLARRPNQKIVIKGTVTTDSFYTDSGKRQQMFGLTARWLKHTMTMETSADSCEGATSMKMEQEGWFVTLSLESESCPVRQPQGASGGCRPRMVIKRSQNPGFLLNGTTRIYQGKDVVSSEVETLALTKDTLDQALFEIPKGYTEVDSMQELMTKTGPIDTSAQTIFADGSQKGKSVKTIAIDFFSGNASKLDQDSLRSYISSKVSAAGMSGIAVNSQGEIAAGNFVNIIGVEIKQLKESGGAKVGGLFGKVTGNDSLAKAGSSQAQIVVTIYGRDGKTVVATAPASSDVKGKGDDAVRAAIDQVIDSLLAKIK